MKNCLKPVLTAGIIAAFSILQASQSMSGWELKKDSDNAKVYTRAIPGNEHKEMRIEMIDDVPFEVVAEVVKDYNNYEKWYGMCKSLKFVNKNGSNDINMYFILDMPVLKNRDALINVKYDFNFEKGVIRITLKSFESNYQINSGLVRMPKIDGTIVVTKEGAGKTKVVYTVFADLASNVPAWLINKMAVKHPYDTGIGIKNQSRKKIYSERAGTSNNKNYQI